MTRMRIFGSLVRRRRAIVCREAVALMTDYLDGALSAPDRARLEAHLAGCPLCTEYLAQLRVTVASPGAADPPHVPEDTVDELVALYRRWKDEDPSPGGAAPA